MNACEDSRHPATTRRELGFGWEAIEDSILVLALNFLSDD